MTTSMREQVSEYIESLQRTIVDTLQDLDNDAPPFKAEDWSRGEGGNGRACTFAASPSDSTSVFEKAAVNISMIRGKLPPTAIK